MDLGIFIVKVLQTKQVSFVSGSFTFIVCYGLTRESWLSSRFVSSVSNFHSRAAKTLPGPATFLLSNRKRCLLPSLS